MSNAILNNEPVKTHHQPLKTLKDLDVKGKRVLCRVDLNVPTHHGRVVDKTRIVKLVPTIQYLIKKQAKVVLLSHFGRPKGFNRDMSLAPLVDELSEALGGHEVKFAINVRGEGAKEAVDGLQPGEVLLVENIRFHEGENKNDPAFVDEVAALGDIYVNDTFSCSHREHASIVGLAKKLPSAAGLLLQEEIENLQRVLDEPAEPVAAIVGGSKVSTKLKLLHALLKKINVLVIGGAMANTFLVAQGKSIGTSLYEKELVSDAKAIIAKAVKMNVNLVLPDDVVVATELTENPPCKIVDVDHIPDNMMVLDLGPNAVNNIARALTECKTLVWNGPLGAFEVKPFDVGTISLARSVAQLTSSGTLTSVAGGGDVVAAVVAAGLTDSFSYISTAGGAFLEWLEGNDLPGVVLLRQ